MIIEPYGRGGPKLTFGKVLLVWIAAFAAMGAFAWVLLQFLVLIGVIDRQ